VFTARVSASMKKKRYDIRLCFDAKTGEYIAPPASWCECKVGSVFCSHTVAMIIAFYILILMRKQKTLTDEQLIALFPMPLFEFQKLLVPFDFLSGAAASQREAAEKRAVKKMLKKMMAELPDSEEEEDSAESDGDGGAAAQSPQAAQPPASRPQKKRDILNEGLLWAMERLAARQTQVAPAAQVPEDPVLAPLREAVAAALQFPHSGMFEWQS